MAGGGLAGISAAARLTDAGAAITLIERRKLLGGRATSFEDQATGQWLDNCQHVLLGCCTELIGLYQRLGVADAIGWFDRIVFADVSGRRSALQGGPLPAPLHLAGSMLRFGLFSLDEKLEIARLMPVIRLMGESGAIEADRQTFHDWLADHHQSPSTIERFWNVIITSALNEDARHVGARYALQVFQEGFLADRRGYVMGVPHVPLAKLYERAVADRVLTSTRVTGISRSGDTWSVSIANGEPIAADAVIVATAPDAARRLLEPFPPMQPTIDRISSFTYRTILGIHLFFDQPVMTEPHLALIGTELDWLFRKDADGCHIHGVISAATRQSDEPTDALETRLLEEIHRLLPAAREARLLSSRIIREKRATWSPQPGIDRLRPSQRTPIPGLYLAGDYTQTGWPATMEGAVRSGRLAAEALLKIERSK